MGKMHFIVKGRVVGVGFRSFAKRLATKFEVTGFVKNVGEDVEVHAEAENLDEFMKAINVQSTSFIGINVERINEKKCECKDFNGFKIIF